MPVTRFNPMVGTSVLVSTLITDTAGDPADPTTVGIYFRSPTGLVTDATVTNVGVGIYTAEHVVDEAGTWVVQVAGDGDLIVVEEASFDVRRSAMPASFST